MNKNKKHKVSCIIPAYNEKDRISYVLAAVIGHQQVDEVIVVNDGSTDGTLDVIRQFKGIRLINYKKNRGKSYAIFRGIKAAKNDLLMFIDADLINLKKKDITDLITPVLKEEADITISLRKTAPMYSRIIGLDFISGERVFSRGLIKNPDDLLKLPGFGLEVFLNNQIINRRLRLRVVKWKNVKQPVPTKKFGFFNGTIRFFKMMKHIIRTIGVFEMLFQVKGLLARRV